ncbi:hypothetical protein MUK42_05411 [Musa troglodytarum]|uniref:Uncharacterized protein n=1 Tax=Musa troglodytarum TaxID=320322 RepID=A0A9E7JFS7_9LILI|nr:hypothetical protein MUK42_05411 [Musa troglodytarum]
MIQYDERTNGLDEIFSNFPMQVCRIEVSIVKPAVLFSTPRGEYLTVTSTAPRRSPLPPRFRPRLPMASPPPPPPTSLPSLLPEIGPDGIARESPVIAYTEKIIEAEQLQLKRTINDHAFVGYAFSIVDLMPKKKNTYSLYELFTKVFTICLRYIQENYSKIREVERELESLTLELKLTAGPKKAALEHLRKKIELSTERIHMAKFKEEQTKKAWEAAVQAVKDEEDVKQKLCDDLNQLDGKLMQQIPSNVIAATITQNQQAERRIPDATAPATNKTEPASDARNQRPVEVKEKKRTMNSGRAKGSMIMPKGRGPSGSGWTGAGFDVDSGT